MTRRQWLQLLPAACASASAADRFRFAVCNETFQQTPFEEQCRIAKKIGYTGIEISPGTLRDGPAQIRRMMADQGLHFVGLHNLLSAPAGLHATTSDPAVRRRTWDHVRGLTDLCAELGSGGIMVFGSGKQRGAAPGTPVSEAIGRLKDGLESVAPHARERGVTILIEPLAPASTNVVNRLEEAAALVRQIDSPAIQTMFDVHNTAAETLPAEVLIGKYIGAIRHVHLNEMDGRGPGTGSYDFKSLLGVLDKRGYGGWLSLEVFDFHPSGQVVASEAFRYLHDLLKVHN